LDLLYQLFSGALALYGATALIAPDIWWRDAAGAATVLLCALLAISLTQRMVWELYFEQKRKIVVPRVVRDVVALAILSTAYCWFSRWFSHPNPRVARGIRHLRPGSRLGGPGSSGNVIAGCVLHFEKPFKVGDWLLFEIGMSKSWR